VKGSDRCRGRWLFAVSMNDDLAALGQVDFQGVQGHGNDLVKTIREAAEVVFQEVEKEPRQWPDVWCTGNRPRELWLSEERTLSMAWAKERCMVRTCDLRFPVALAKLTVP